MVELQPLDRATVLGHLARTGLRLDADVEADAGLLELLQSPLMLSVVTSAYRGRTAAPLPAGSAQERRARLFSEVLDRATADEPGRPSTYRPERALDWLAQLAGLMRARGESEFRLDLIQPDWLDSRAAQRLALFAPQLLTVVAAFALSFGLYAPVGGSLPALALALAALVLNFLIASQLPPPSRFPVEPVEQPGWRPAPARLPTFVQRLLPSYDAAATPADPDYRPGPADGIRRSARQAAVAGGWVLLLVLPPLAWAAAQASAVAAGLAATVTLVLVVVVLPVAMRFGGQACCRHLAVRALLVREVGVPWRLGRLLGEAAARRVLVRTGSGYRFPHRLAMDHLAGTHVADQVAATKPLATRPSTRKPSITR